MHAPAMPVFPFLMSYSLFLFANILCALLLIAGAPRASAFAAAYSTTPTAFARCSLLQAHLASRPSQQSAALRQQPLRAAPHYRRVSRPGLRSNPQHYANSLCALLFIAASYCTSLIALAIASAGAASIITYFTLSFSIFCTVSEPLL